MLSSLPTTMTCVFPAIPFDLLRGETNSIYNVITRISHDRILHLQFGRLPLEGGDRGDSGDGDDGGGVDKRARVAK